MIGNHGFDVMIPDLFMVPFFQAEVIICTWIILEQDLDSGPPLGYRSPYISR